MPIYAYRCAACGFEKDVLQKLSDAPLTVCPQCGQEAFAKTITAPAFQLKGSGWYVTDFRDGGKGKKPAEGGKDGAKAAEPASGGEAKDGGSREGASKAGEGGSGSSESSGAAKSAGAGTSTSSGGSDTKKTA